MSAKWEDVASDLASIGLPAIGQLIGNMAIPVIGGSVGKAAGSLAASAVAAALGVTPEPAAVSAAIQADPSGAQIKLAQIDAESKQQLAVLADMQNARGMETAAIQVNSKLQWVPVFLSVINYLFLAAIIVAVMFGKLREDGIVVGYVLGGATTVFQYWFGSSSGSQGKDQTFQQIARTATTTGVPAVHPAARAAPANDDNSNASIIAKALKL